MARRALLDQFQLPNLAYIGCSATFYTTSATGAATAFKATLYDDLTGTGTLLNPQTFDSDGKLPQPTYIEVAVVPVITGAHVASQTLGVVSPPGGGRGDWATATQYLPGDIVTDGAAGTATGDIYVVVNFHQSGVWATDSANANKLKLVLDVSTLSIAPTWSLAAEGKVQAATRAEINAANATKGMRPDQFLTSKFDPTGKHLIPIMSAGMQAATTNGAAAGAVETTTNKVLYRTLDFDTTTQEFAGFALPMPSSWNESTVTFRAVWTAASGAGGVAWALQGVACSDDDAIDTAYGTEQVVTDTLLTAGDVHRTAESSAITIAGTPAASDMVFFRVKRVPANASDTLAVDARLIGVELFITTDNGYDA